MPTATCPIPAHESSHVRRAWRARSYEGIEHPAKPTAARRSWPRCSIMRLTRSPVHSQQQHLLKESLDVIAHGALSGNLQPFPCRERVLTALLYHHLVEKWGTTGAARQ